MHAVVSKTFGSVEVVPDAENPLPRAGHVLVRQLHSSICAGDALMAFGRPWLLRPVFSLMLRPPILGRDVAGVVEAVGAGVTSVAVGDPVVGEAGQAWAERVLVREGALARVPDGVSLRDAAALAVSGITALQGLRDVGDIKTGSHVLIVGASGGVGHLAVQIAVALGATVTGVCSAAKAERVRELGAAHIIDYTSASYVDPRNRFDLVLDLVAWAFWPPAVSM
jgi:NADPH:quinone reductase-like Zn-dependent oxidoreductase